MRKMKLLVIGLDGATYDLMKPWAQDGMLPTLQKLLNEGTAGELRSTVPPMTAPAWTSFMTGKNPGKHGLYDWIYRHADSYNVSPVTAQHCQEPTLWELLSYAGKRVCVVNVPMTFPPSPVNGTMIAGMPAPSTRATITYPAGLLAELEAELGKYLLYPDPGQAYSDAGVDAFLDRLYRTTEMRLQVMEHLRAREDWDFFMMVLNGTDTVQHALWKYMSPTHPLHDPAKYAKYGDAILRYFQYVDGSLGEIVAGLDEETVLMLMSDHGFGPFHTFIHVNNWLRQHGWLKLKRTPISRIKSTAFDLGVAPMTIYDLLMRVNMGRLKREVVRGKRYGLLKRLFLSFDDVDWPNTAAYSLGNVGQIRLNVRGREPEGSIDPGAQYEATREAIMTQLWEFRDPATGEQIVQEVYRREELYTGNHVEHAADIVFIPTRLEYFGFGEYEFGSHKILENMKRGISGTHRPNGMLLLRGAPVHAGTWLTGARIVDLAPTILHLMGQPPAADMDGTVLTDALTSEYATVRWSAATGGSSTRPSTADDHLSAEEAELLAERLRGLGYIG